MVAQMIIRGKFEAVMAMKTIDRARRSTEDGKTVVIPSLERPKQRIVFSSSPNSASCERVFALLRNLFGELQMRSLADYVQAALMLNYNQRSVG